MTDKEMKDYVEARVNMEGCGSALCILLVFGILLFFISGVIKELKSIKARVDALEAKEVM